MNSLIKKLHKASNDLYIYKQTRRALYDAAVRLRDLQEEWEDTTEDPRYYESLKEQLRRDWPELADAIDRACR